MVIFTDSYSESSATLTAHMWQTKCRQIYPHENGDITDSYSDSSYLIPTLTPHIDSYSDSSYLADQVLEDLPPLEWRFYRFPLPTLTAHIRQTKCRQIYPLPPSNGDGHH